MKKEISIFMFIDALGWEIVKKNKFMEDILPHQYKAQMQFGYSCTAIPTILTGVTPVEHRHLSLFYYDPENSPFKMFKYLKFLPKKIFDRWRIRHAFSKFIAKQNGYTGYFEIYSVPFERMQYFDYVEKNDIFIPGGLAPVPNLADKLEKSKIPYHISNWRLTEQQNIDSLISQIENEKISFSFLYTAAMDSMLHRVTKDGTEIPEKLDWYRSQIENILEKANQHYEKVNLCVMSDHGMTTLTEGVDLKKKVENLGLKYGKDYVGFYDSTLARFHYFNEKSRKAIQEILPDLPHSSLMNKKDKQRFGIDFENNMYGEDIVLMDAGYQIEPCDLGMKALPGMHGFSPDHPDSYASFLSSYPIQDPPAWVGDFHRIMVDKMKELS